MSTLRSKMVGSEEVCDGKCAKVWNGLPVTCMLGRGRGKVPAHDLRSSSRARLSISNCLSCSRTEASREAVLAHCSIHTLRAEHRTGQDQHQGGQKRFNHHQDFNQRTDPQQE